ncbi:hypothetical protein [Kordia jejudonensis]|nr:hypothetical protein [Kordia jejudonensis]
MSLVYFVTRFYIDLEKNIVSLKAEKLIINTFSLVYQLTNGKYSQ